MNPVHVRAQLARFLEEDLGHVPYASSDPAASAECRIEAQETGIMCGGDLLVPLFALATPDGWTRPERLGGVAEGAQFGTGAIIAHLRLHPEALRHGIRTALNLLQHLCGVATRTRELASRLAGGRCTLLDTRKTTPGLRVFEKYAARVGGARNHRFGRYDGVMLKKEDIALAGGIRQAIDAAASEAAHLTAIEVEVETLDDLTTVLFDGRARHVMLDNMTPHQVNQAVAMTGGKLVLEASGISPDDLEEYAATGVPFISTSAMIATARKIKLHLRVG
ncbi:MAG TPA: carboxylating nicotinate-nucleotide diphosphorylase [Candidatus Eisenbacteria bacterium]|jgi:nicotinate-nucleotide pyrophosphorylase (carboxylating)|nr:carboxylating nicotinate-nucleotide diphosphorylase [Candidatus Eisenbacteria bacterium]